MELETLRSLLRPAAAELVGSALFVFVACGAGMTTVKYTFVGSTTIGIALAFGMTITVLCYSIGHISGGHLNFAVTLTMCVLRRISIMRAAFYFLGQLIGGLIGIGFLKAVTPLSWWSSCFAVQSIQPELTVMHALVTEVILTFFLMFVVMAACDSQKSNQTLVPLAIGLAVFCAHMIGLPIDGCSINPTRTFASAAAASGVSGCDAWANHWVFWFGPLMGAVLAGGVYEYCFTASVDGVYKVDRLIDMVSTSSARTAPRYAEHHQLLVLTLLYCCCSLSLFLPLPVLLHAVSAQAPRLITIAVPHIARCEAVQPYQRRASGGGHGAVAADTAHSLSLCSPSRVSQNAALARYGMRVRSLMLRLASVQGVQARPPLWTPPLLRGWPAASARGCPQP